MKRVKFLLISIMIVSLSFNVNVKADEDFLQVGDTFEYELVKSNMKATIGNKTYDVDGAQLFLHYDEGTYYTFVIDKIVQAEDPRDSNAKINITYPNGIKSGALGGPNQMCIPDCIKNMINCVPLARKLVTEWNESKIEKGYEIFLGSRQGILFPYFGNYSLALESLKECVRLFHEEVPPLENETVFTFNGDYYTFESSWGGSWSTHYYGDPLDVVFNDHYKFTVNNKTGMMLGAHSKSWLNGTYNDIPIELSLDVLIEEKNFDLEDFKLKDIYRTKGLGSRWIVTGMSIILLFTIIYRFKKKEKEYK